MSNPTHTARWQKITLATLFMGYTGYYLCRSNLSVAATLISADFPDTITKDQIGAISSIGVLLYSLGKVSNGILVDFLGGRKLFLLGMIVSIACTVLFGFGTSIVMFALVWGVNRYFQSMGWGGLIQIASRWYPVSVQATVMGTLSLSYLFGDALVRLYLGTFIQAGMSWRGVFFLSAATLAVVAVVTAFLLKATPKEVGADEPPGDPANLFGADGLADQPQSLGRLLLPLLGSLTFWLVCFMNVGLTLIRESFTFWIPTYLKEAHHFDEGKAAQYSMVFPLVGAVSAVLGGILSDRLKGRHALVAMPALALLAGTLFVLSAVSTAGTPGLALVLLGAVAFFLMTPYSFCSGVIALNLGGKRGSSTAAGIIDAAGYFGATLSGYGVGALAQRHGWPSVFFALAVVAVLSGGFTGLYWLRQPSRAAPKTSPPS